MAEHMRSELVTDALQMALARRKPEGEVIHHSDQGSQYVSLAFGQKAATPASPSRLDSRGDCFDNAMVESFWGRMQAELFNRKQARIELATAIHDYIELFHNTRRRHSALGMLTPTEYEDLHNANREAA